MGSEKAVVEPVVELQRVALQRVGIPTAVTGSFVQQLQHLGGIEGVMGEERFEKFGDRRAFAWRDFGAILTILNALRDFGGEEGKPVKAPVQCLLAEASGECELAVADIAGELHVMDGLEDPPRRQYDRDDKER